MTTAKKDLGHLSPPPEGVDKLLNLVELCGDVDLADEDKARLPSRGEIHTLNRELVFLTNCYTEEKTNLN